MNKTLFASCWGWIRRRCLRKGLPVIGMELMEFASRHLLDDIDHCKCPNREKQDSKMSWVKWHHISCSEFPLQQSSAGMGRHCPHFEVSLLKPCKYKVPRLKVLASGLNEPFQTHQSCVLPLLSAERN